jgi:hypothetical protein
MISQMEIQQKCLTQINAIGKKENVINQSSVTKCSNISD